MIPPNSPNLLKILIASVFVAIGISYAIGQTNTTGSALWSEYQLNPEDHSHIPNVSFAGYMRGEAPIPDVPVVVDIRSFGGAGDGVTLNDMAIRQAIDAAWLQGGGAVFFPAGEYLIDRMILLHRDGVVLRGAGPGQTILRFTKPLVSGLGSTGTGTQEWNWTGGLLWIGPRDYMRLNAFNANFLRWNRVPGAALEFDEDPNVNWGGAWENWSTLGQAGVIASVTSIHQRGDRTVTVDDASGLRPGDFVMMSWVNPRHNNALWREMVQHTAFNGTTLFNQWLATAIPYWPWPVEIAAVDGNEVTLAQPIRVSIQPQYNVTFKHIGPHGRTSASFGGRWQAVSPFVEKAGVEDLTILMDNNRETYSYNNGDGWNGIFFNRAYNSWARNVEIVNAETAINVASAKNISIIDVDIRSPFQAKYISTNRVHSHDVLYDGVRVTNTGVLTNGINTEWISTGNVWTRHDLRKGTFDSHRMMSFDYLRTDIVLDNPAESRPGGASQAGPFTGRRAVHWNVTVRDSDRPEGERGLWILDPEQYTFGAQIGIQGADPVFRSDEATPNIWAMPSGDKNMLMGDIGITPAPANLFDAQVAHRLGSNPMVVLDTPARNFYSTTRPIVLRAAGHPGQGRTLQSLSYYRAGELLGTVTEAPFAFHWQSPIAGRHDITVRMVDDLGHVTESRPYTIVVGRRELLEHNDARIRYTGNWSVSTMAPTAAGDAFFSGNQARTTTAAGAYAEITFRGTRLRWVTGHDGQAADVLLNGQLMANVAFERVGNRAYQATVWDSGELPDAEHTVRIIRTSGTLHLDHLIVDFTDGEFSVPIPYAFFSVTPERGPAPLQVMVDATLSSGLGHPIANFIWDFGDGTTVSGPEAIRSHTYTTDGLRTITLTVESSGGTTASFSTSVIVGNQLPIARLSHQPATGAPPLPVTFDASASTDPDGQIVRFDWNFGDGRILTNGGPVVSHTYTAFGTFQATVTVWDNSGATDSASVTVSLSLDPVLFARINFQPATTSTPGGWLADTGALFANRGNGFSYGWLTAPGATRQRNAGNSPDLLHDTLIHTVGAVWEMSVPNGEYQVRLVSGDPGHFDSVYRTAIEGVLAVDGIPASSTRWIEGNVRVTVTDGRLTLADAPGASNNKWCFVEIHAIPEPPDVEPDAFIAWQAANGISGAPHETLDGVPHLLRYALGGDAATPAAQLMPLFAVEREANQVRLQLVFNRIDDPLLTYAVWFSEDLINWGSEPVWQGNGAHNGSPAAFEVSVPTQSLHGFLRLIVGRTP